MGIEFTREKVGYQDSDQITIDESWTRQEIEEAIIDAFCPPPDSEKPGNPFIDCVVDEVFPRLGEFTVERREEYGGDLHFTETQEFLDTWNSGEIHPMDLKKALVEAIDSLPGD